MIENPVRDVEGGGKGKLLLDMVLSRKVDAVVVYSIGRGAYEWLRSYGVKIYVADKMDLVENLVEKLVKGELKEAVEPPSRFEH